MARKFLTSIDLNNNEIQNVKAQQLASDPGSPANGQWWYRTDTNVLKWRINGTTRDMAWLASTAPTGLSQSSTNSAGTSAEAAHVDHTHAITSSSQGQSAASTIAAFNASGKLESAVTAASDGTNTLTTKGYVDALAQGIDVRQSVRCATAAALSTYGTTPSYNSTGGTSARGQITWATGPTAVDGVTLANNDRILVKDEAASHASHGIYVRTSQNTWDRATDFDADAEATAGAYMWVEEGTTNADSGWILTTNNPITLGGASGTALTFTLFASAGSIIAGNGLTKTGNTLDVGAGTGITVAADTVGITTNGVTDALLRQSGALSVIGRSANSTGNVADISAASDGQVLRRAASVLGFGALDLASANAVTGALGYANGGTGQSSYAAGDLIYASAINTLAKRTIGSTGDLLTVVGGVPAWQAPATTGLARKYSVAVGDGVATTITVTHNLNTQDVVVTVYQNSSTWDVVECDVKNATANTVTLTFAVAPSTNQYKCVVIG